MSNKVPEEIDLNCDAVPVHQENERSVVNVGQPASGSATSCLTETVLAAGVDELGKESKIESVKSQGIDLEADIGSLGEAIDDKVSAGLSSGGVSLMGVDGGTGDGDGDGDGKSGSMEDKKPVEDSLIERTSVRSSSLADNTVHSGDGEPLSSAVQSSLPDENQKLSSKEKEVSSGGLESCDMEICAPDSTKKNQTTVTQGERDSQNAENSNQTTSNYEDGSSDVDTKPEDAEFCVSDLVWGKVRSHPWWPGQIFDSSAATAKAKKYFKKESYLIAYYGDQTFAWNEASQIKPFRSHFSHMAKKNNMEEFHHAVGCALDEVSRRVEFSLACSCISEEAYSQIKTEIIVNAGIREEFSRRDGGDRFSSASSFDSLELVKTIKKLAQSPSCTDIDRVQFTISKAQLLAFHRWKGYSQLPEFQNLCGSLETDAEIPLSEEMKKYSKLIKNEVPSVKVDKRVYSEEEELDSQDGSSSKQKKNLTVSGEKEKSLSEFIAERRLSLQNVKRKLNKNGDDMLISSSPAKKLKAVDPVCNDLAMKQNKSNVSTASVDKPLQSKQTFGVGASILRVASQLNGSIFSTPLLKHSDGKSQKATVGNKSKGKSSSGKSRGKKVSQTDISSSDNMLSQLHLAATDPLKGYNFLASIIFFFTELRNSIAMDINNSEMSEQSLEQGTDAIVGEKSTKFKLTGMSEFTSIKDSSCSERIIQCLPEEQLTVDKNNQTMEKGFSVVESHTAAKACANVDSEQMHATVDENLGMETEDQSPTSLILKFSDIDSVPAVEELNKIFSRYGPLVTRGTEVFRKSIQAKVVFKRRTDAETAFSSSGKYSIFGPSLISYRLKRLASTPSKASQGGGKKSRVDETSGD
ncbi:Tudor/PWWP/MBT superfamily protein, putative isoform 4 [Hibiscus syriacus]|uniref:Tudor/PWWP/MBT superfamily protein, putative isoform 4 n=1 Tax=Hibiscus syriacus TaxID=106335 RepID=A0A6A2XW04_HIBSY|nr:uncharacterized protein LOC120180940 [Hibiscus syriacus]KAE8666216.1 Tudor/PWWP/MBT superfamily protein, putative isoform 4 [Hibiscus syriacus]